MCDRHFCCRDCVNGERCYSVLLRFHRFILNKNPAYAFIPGAKPAASHYECRYLDSSGDAN